MAHPSQWRDRGRRSPASASGSWSDPDDTADSKPSQGHRPGQADHRRPYSPVAETLFRKDLISAMKLPDNEPLEADDYWQVQDTWKQEWERGVQVPVKPNGLPEPHVSAVVPSCKSERFTLSRKLICMNTSGSYRPETHQVTPMVLRAEQVCCYDLDNVDKAWLEALNGERALSGLNTVTESEMERTMEEMERQCREKIHSTLRHTDDIDIGQDDNIICDVCRSPDSEESNEMVFCDQCNICVHQACYGITDIPSGPWLCRTCSLGIKPPCELCPNKGGAMKSTRTGQKWAHVSCALWIPEVSIGDVEKMEPITKISCIPPSRWSLMCVLCKERGGSCIQCSVKTCKTAYHVTCAFKNNLEMRAIIEDEQAEDGVKLRSYCHKHSLNSKKKTLEDSDSEKNMTPEEKSQARRQKMAKVEREFFKVVDLTLTAKKVDIGEDVVDLISRYWMLKRKAGGNKPLLPARGDDEASALRGEDTEHDRMKMLVNIRQDLERVRNLAYMVSRREKLSRSYVKLREQTLEKQLALLADEDPQNQMSLMDMSAILEANHGPTVYDKTFSNPESEQHTQEDFEVLICRIAGEISEGSSQIRRDNPFRKKSSDFPSNSRTVPYERIFSDTSQSESDDSLIKLSSSQPRFNKKNIKETHKSSSSKSKLFPSKVTRSDSSMSSSEEELALKNLSPNKSFGSTKKKNIYSDSESEAEKTPRGRGRGRPPKKQKMKDIKSKKFETEGRFDSEDTQNSFDPKPKEVRTKAAMKAFSYDELAISKKVEKKDRLKDDSDDSMMDLDENQFQLVSQRAAAKKAEQKFSKTGKVPDIDPKKESKSSELFGTSDEDSSISRIANSVTQKWDDDNLVRKSPRRKKKHTSTDSESSDDDQKPSYINNKLLSPAKRDKKLSEKHLSKSSKYSSSKMFSGSSDEGKSPRKNESHKQLNFDDLFAHDNSDSDSDAGKKKLFDDFEHPEVYSDFVPQRRAAKKASAQLSEQNIWKKTQQEKYLAELAKQNKEVGKKKCSKVKESGSETEVVLKRRTRSSSASPSGSESDTEKRKSPRGRGRSPKGLPPKHKESKIQNRKPALSRKSKKKGVDGEGKISSSKALEYLMQRESQLSNILGDLKGEPEVPDQPQPDKKLKTSEGRADGFQSPPVSTKNSSDSDSDTSSQDSIILGIKARKQPSDQEKPRSERTDTEQSGLDTRQLPSAAQEPDHRGPDRGPGGHHDLPVGGGIRVSDTPGRLPDNPRDAADDRPPASEDKQLKQSGERTAEQKKSIFSPERSPKLPPDTGRDRSSSGSRREHDSSREKTERQAADWKSPREWNGVKSKDKVGKEREISTSSISPSKSPALNKSLEGSRSSPLQQQHRSPAFGRSPARHAQHPLNKSLEFNKISDESKGMLSSEAERDQGRKMSVESKDSDADSAKSSLPENGLPEFSKEDSSDTIFPEDKLGDLKPKSDPLPANKKDEGYVSAEKDQNDNAQDTVGKQRDITNILSEKLTQQKGPNKRMSTEDLANVPEGTGKQNLSWPEMFSHQQHLDEQQRGRIQQQQHKQQELDALTKDSRQQVDGKSVADQLASQQYEALYNINQIMNNHQRKAGGNDMSQQQIAYMQQYMKELTNSNAAYQMQAYQLQLLQQMQSTYGLKPQDQEMMMLMQAQVAQVQAQQHQQEVWYQEQLKAEQRKHDEKRIMEERRKQEEKRQQEEKKRLEDQRRKEELFRKEELKRQEEQRRHQEQKRRLEEEKRLEQERQKREEEERKRKEEEQRKFLLERLQKEEEARQREKQNMLDNQRRLEEHRIEQEKARIEEQRRMDFQRQGNDFLRQQQEYRGLNPFLSGSRGTVGHVEDQLGALMGKSTEKSDSSRLPRPGSPKHDKKAKDQGPYQIPSATPADQLPGFLPSRAHIEPHEGKTNHVKRDRDTPHSLTGSDVSHTSAPSGIPNELLDSVLETSKLPVWKPPDKGLQPQPSQSPEKISSPTKPAPVTSDRDISFDDLVRHIDSSPSQKDKETPLPHKAPSDQVSASEADYDNDQGDMGGVDYDDFEDYPRRPAQKKAPCYKDQPLQENSKSADRGSSRRVAKAPCYAEKNEEEFDIVKLKPGVAQSKPPPAKNQKKGPGRVFGGRKNLKIDQKGIEKVHKNLAGTDFDFENEFDDDFGSSPKPEIKSLKGLREHIRKGSVNAVENDQVPPVPDTDEDGEKFMAEELKIEAPPHVEKLPKISLKLPKISLKKQLKNRAEEEVEAILENVEAPKPKVPTLKIKIGGRNESPSSPEVEKSKKRNLERIGSVESEDSISNQRIPKLKIKFGGPKAESETAEMKEPTVDEPLIRRTPTSSPARQRRTPQHSSKPGTPAREKLSTSELVIETMKSSPRTLGHSTSSPSRKNRDRTEDNADLQKIFGQGEPLPVSGVDGQPNISAEKSDDGPSELELLALELSNQLAKERKMKEQKDDDPEDDDYDFHHDPKYKFKQFNKPSSAGRQTTSPTPPTPVKMSNPSQSSGGAVRSRKKELLNQYYGIELPLPPPTAPLAALPMSNGPWQSVVEVSAPPPLPAPPPTKPTSHLREPPVRNIIKMPKAVASVTSVPTRADYQQQLEANMERKRKREGKPDDYKKGKGGKGSKGKQKNAWEEPSYKPKIKMAAEDQEESKELRKTRGKPPKKCLAVDDDSVDDPVESFIQNKKNESMKYAAEVLASFDNDEGKTERRRKDKKKRRRDNDEVSQPKEKTPRIVIKFSKNKESAARNTPTDNNGLMKPPASKESDSHQKLPKLKIKNLIEPAST